VQYAPEGSPELCSADKSFRSVSFDSAVPPAACGATTCAFPHQERPNKQQNGQPEVNSNRRPGSGAGIDGGATYDPRPLCGAARPGWGARARAGSTVTGRDELTTAGPLGRGTAKYTNPNPIASTASRWLSFIPTTGPTGSLAVAVRGRHSQDLHSLSASMHTAQAHVPAPGVNALSRPPSLCWTWWL